MNVEDIANQTSVILSMTKRTHFRGSWFKGSADGLLYLVAFAIALLRVQLRFVDCINKRKKKKRH